MRRTLTSVFVAFATLLLVAACGNPTKQDLIGKAENVKTKTELQNALGDPDELNKVGPVEQWIYKASDGTVVFLITGDSVTLKMAGGSGSK